MTSHSTDDEDPQHSAPLSADAITPRGGFMARPGLKSPPRHAVVVRGGDAPESEHIPLLRPSAPPPPPASVPPPPTTDEKITLRAIPTPPSPKVGVALASLASAVGESFAPPCDAPTSRAPLSDAPFVTSSLEMPSSAPHWQRPASRWTIVAAAAAGLVLGLASVAAKLSASGAAAQPPQGVALSVVAAASTPGPVNAVLASSAAQPAKVSAPAASSEQVETKHRSVAPSAKRTIF